MYIEFFSFQQLTLEAPHKDIAVKTRKKLNLITPVKIKVGSKSLEVIYRSCVPLSLEYANIVSEGSYDSDIVKLCR